LRAITISTGSLADSNCFKLSQGYLAPGTTSENLINAQLLFHDGYSLSVDNLLSYSSELIEESKKMFYLPQTGKLNFPYKKQIQPYCHFLNILKCCPALKAIAFKSTIEQLSFAEGFALISYLQLFDGAIERFTSKSIGWGKSTKDLDEITNFIAKNLSPFSCSKLQELKICPFNSSTHCMESVKGREPSPIRFAKYPVNTKYHLNNFLEGEKQ